MTPFVPLEAATGIGGAVFATAVALYMPEIRAVADWVFRYRQKRNEEIARMAANMTRDDQLKRTAEAIARLPEFAPKKGPPANSDDEGMKS